MRLIDADLIAQQMRELPHEYSNKEQRSRTGGIAACQEIVRESPTIDAVSVVRCKECKWADNCSQNVAMRESYQMYEKLNFCSYGERKENE